MSSRQDEKKKRREEREAQERAAAQSKKRTRLVLIGFGVATVLAVVVIAGVLIAGSGGDDESKASTTAASGAAVPAREITDFDEAVKASGCTFKEYPSEGSTHQEEPFTDYKTNPPTSGTHNPEPAQDGVYDAGNSPEVNNWVHTLEHGRILIQYKPGTPKKTIDQLTTLTGENVNGSPGYHMVLMENTTDMPYEVAAVSWTRTLGCKDFDEKAFDAIRAFRDKYVDKAPELVP
ncbi:MAG: DUF3105 domain-containing protein [Solirubrobacteraceae bacterium]|nr:DUF3105 domain-containing protein [Solirubrobacteraceae bacterium]